MAVWAYGTVGAIGAARSRVRYGPEIGGRLGEIGEDQWRSGEIGNLSKILPRFSEI